MSWFTDIRKVALLACVTGALSLLWSVWSLIQALPQMQPGVAAIALAPVLAAASTLVFYFALHRNQGTLTFPRGLRRLSLTAAVAFGVIIAVDLPGVLEALDSYWRTGSQGSEETLAMAVRLVGEASNFCYLLLLAAIYRAGQDEGSAGVDASGLLEVVSRVAVMLNGLLVVYSLLAAGAMPYFYWTNRVQIQRSGQDPEVIGNMLAGPLTKVVITACIFAAPYIVAISLNRVARGEAAMGRIEGGLEGDAGRPA